MPSYPYDVRELIDLLSISCQETWAQSRINKKLKTRLKKFGRRGDKSFYSYKSISKPLVEMIKLEMSTIEEAADWYCRQRTRNPSKQRAQYIASILNPSEDLQVTGSTNQVIPTTPVVEKKPIIITGVTQGCVEQLIEMVRKKNQWTHEETLDRAYTALIMKELPY